MDPSEDDEGFPFLACSEAPAREVNPFSRGEIIPFISQCNLPLHEDKTFIRNLRLQDTDLASEEWDALYPDPGIRYMDPGIASLLEAAELLECDTLIVAKALLFYHYCKIRIKDDQFDSNMLGAAALHCSSRCSESIIDMDKIIMVYYCVVNRTTTFQYSDGHRHLYVLRKGLHVMFTVVLRNVLPIMSRRLPHQFLTSFLSNMGERSRKIKNVYSHLAATCMCLLSDFFTRKNCLEHEPEHIAIAVMDIALRLLKLYPIKELDDPWFMGFCPGLTSRMVGQIKCIIYAMYEDTTWACNTLNIKVEPT